MEFSVKGSNKNLKWPIVLGHYLPWFTQEDPGRFSLPDKEIDGLVVPRIESWRHWRDCRSQYKRTHLSQPLWGEYDSRDPEIIRKQIETAKKFGLDGFIINLYGKNSVENLIGLSFLRELDEYNSRNSEDPFVYMISFDSQAQSPTEGKTPVSIEEDFEYLRDTWFGKYSIRRDGIPVMSVFAYEKPFTEYMNAADKVFGKDGLDIIWPNAAETQGLTAAYAWVRPDKFESDGSWFENDNPGDSFLREYYHRCNSNPELKYIMGGVWPGFNDQLVSWAWNSNSSNPNIRPRVICDESTKGNTLKLTWMAAEEYISNCRNGVNGHHKPMPLIQIVTWNDWAESTNVEPDCKSGFKSLEICLDSIKKLKGNMKLHGHGRWF
jgi:hypothetical protein